MSRLKAVLGAGLRLEAMAFMCLALWHRFDGATADATLCIAWAAFALCLAIDIDPSRARSSAGETET